MTIVYFDSSAFVKLLVEEDDSDLAATLWDGCEAAVSSRLAYPEVRAALAAARRAGRLSDQAFAGAEEFWGRVWASTRPVEVTQAVTAAAGALVTPHALSGADAVHLASLLGLKQPDTIFASWDRRLRNAGIRTGARLAPAPGAV